MLGWILGTARGHVLGLNAVRHDLLERAAKASRFILK